MKRLDELKNLGWGVEDIAELLEELKQCVYLEKGATCGRPSNLRRHKRVVTKESTDNLEAKVSVFLRNMGIVTSIKGFAYMKEAIIYCIENQRTIISISVTNELYPTVAKKFSTTGSRVERAMRHAVEKAWINYNPYRDQVFGYTVSETRGNPTVSEFIATTMEYLTLHDDVSID